LSYRTEFPVEIRIFLRRATLASPEGFALARPLCFCPEGFHQPMVFHRCLSRGVQPPFRRFRPVPRLPPDRPEGLTGFKPLIAGLCPVIAHRAQKWKGSLLSLRISILAGEPTTILRASHFVETAFPRKSRETCTDDEIRKNPIVAVSPASCRSLTPGGAAECGRTQYL